MKIDYDDNYQGCFICGKSNDKGLKLDFSYEEEVGEVCAIWKPLEYMQGFKGIVHGGFIFMLLDEVMAKACLYKKIPAVTARIEIRFKKPVYVDEEMEVKGKILEIKGKKIKLWASCMDIKGIERVSAEGLFIVT